MTEQPIKMELNDLIDFLYKMSKCDYCIFTGVEKNEEEQYEFTFLSDWGDGGISTNRSFTVDADGGFTSDLFDDIAMDVRIMYEETIERKEKARKREEILNKLTVEERAFLDH